MPFLSIVNFYYTVLNFKCKKKNNRLNGANERVPESEALRVCYVYVAVSYMALNASMGYVYSRAPIGI